jgi:hypothetical protein
MKEKVEYYMHLNEVGRGSLLRSERGFANRAEWVEMLISVINDLDCLFYFISMNPTLCQYANTSKLAPVLITEEFGCRRRHTIQHPQFLPTEKDTPELKDIQSRRSSAF